MTDELLEEIVGRLFRERSLTLALAESCTGGLIAHRLTNVPGSSEFLLGGVVAYANDIKERIVGVGHDTLVAHGAVSEETAREMAHGVRQRFATAVGLSVTGIAGPGGGTEEKPVGLTWIALSASDGETARHFVWSHDRAGNKEASAQAALQMLVTFASELA